MNERLIEVRRKIGLSQKDFSERIKMSQTGYASLETGVNRLTDRTIADVCREFNVSEQWLRHGIGEMHPQPADVDEELAGFIGSIIRTESTFIKNAILLSAKILQGLTDEQKRAFEQAIVELAEQLKKEREEEEGGE